MDGSPFEQNYAISDLLQASLVAKHFSSRLRKASLLKFSHEMSPNTSGGKLYLWLIGS